MPQAYQTRYVFQGGVNNAVPDELIGEQELSDAANYQPDLATGKGVIKREGLTTTSSLISATGSSVYQGRNANYFTAGTVTYSFAGSSLDPDMTAGYPDWTTFATYDLMVNGTNLRQSSNGTSFAAISGCPAGSKYIAAVNNFLYVAGHDKGKLRWTDAGTLTFTVTNELILTQDENDDITALKPWRNGLLVLCSKSFEIISGYSTLEQGVAYYSKEAGCTSHRSVVVTPNGVFWWSQPGIVWLKPDYTIDYPMLRKLSTTLAALNRGQDAYVHATFDPLQHRVMFYVYNGASQTTCNLRIDYYYESDSFWLHTGAGAQMAASGMAIVTGVANNYAIGYTSTYLYKVSGNTDNGTAVSSYLETRRESSGGPTAYKTARKSTLTTNLSSVATIDYGVYVDNGSTVDSTWSLERPSGLADEIIGTNRQHRKIKHRISDSAITRTRIVGLTTDGVVHRSV